MTYFMLHSQGGASPLAIPEGFHRTAWSDVRDGDVVFIAGKDRAYGPHYVHDAARRRLRNARGNVFSELQETLLHQEVADAGADADRLD